MFRANLTAMHYGLAAGEPCVEIITDVPATYDEALRRRQALLSSIAACPGLASYWIPRGPWGQENCDPFLLPILEGPAVVRATLDILDTRRTNLHLHQVVDATVLLAEAVEVTHLRQGLARRMQVPRAEQVVAWPAPDNLSGPHLDAISNFLTAAGVEPIGFVYVPPDLLDLALAAVAKAGTPWRAMPVVPTMPRIPLLELV
jgi:hypothetical protein